MDLTLANFWQHLRLPVWPLMPIYFWWSNVFVNSLDNLTNRPSITRAMLSSHLAARDLPCFFSNFPAALPCYTKNACCVSKKKFAELIFANCRFWKKFADLIFADLIKTEKITSTNIYSARNNDARNSLLNTFSPIFMKFYQQVCSVKRSKFTKFADDIIYIDIYNDDIINIELWRHKLSDMTLKFDDFISPLYMSELLWNSVKLFTLL